jgi:hypothetical protein
MLFPIYYLLVTPLFDDTGLLFELLISSLNKSQKEVIHMPTPSFVSRVALSA